MTASPSRARFPILLPQHPPHRPRPALHRLGRPLPQIPLHHGLRLVPQRRLRQRQRPQPLHRRAPHRVALILRQQRHRSRRANPPLPRIRHSRYYQSQMPASPRLLHRQRLQQPCQLIRIPLQRPAPLSVIRRATSAARFRTSISSPNNSRTSARTAARSSAISSASARAGCNPKHLTRSRSPIFPMPGSIKRTGQPSVGSVSAPTHFRTAFPQPVRQPRTCQQDSSNYHITRIIEPI